MINDLARIGYVLDTSTKVWSRPGYTGIAYSDGDEVERRIGAIMADAHDLTVLSTELRQHCTDWPSLYHLTSARANILRPFEAALSGDILEIGAGCGAITRYLGECGANVLALEGSPRRASIARSRTRDLDNVTVVSDKFDQLLIERQFDLVTLIGVFEYASQFTEGDSPGIRMLERVRGLLKPNGKLIIAIENQLGLKYFAGAPEDHLWQAMSGIEDRYAARGPRTYGRKVMADMLSQAGFASSEFLAPFPDYKLPATIITEEGASAPDFDAAALACQSIRKDPQLPQETHFSLDRVWPIIFSNGLGIGLANSHLIVAAAGSGANLVRPGDLAFHFSTARKPSFCKETSFVRSPEAHALITVKCRPLAGVRESAVSPEGDLAFHWPADAAYEKAVPLSQRFMRIVTMPEWTIDEVVEFFEEYLRDIFQILSREGIRLDSTSRDHVFLPGEYLDAIPSNILVDEQGSASYIDREWHLKQGVALDYLVFRALLSLLDSVSKFAIPRDAALTTRGALVRGVMKGLGLATTGEDFSNFLILESRMSSFATGISGKAFSTWSPDQILPGLSGSSEVQIRELKAEIQQLAAAKQLAEELAYARQAELANIRCLRFYRLLRALRLKLRRA